MEIRKLRFLFSLLFVTTLGMLNGQSILDKANKQFELRAYDLALENYKTVYSEDLSCHECMFKIAECYRFMNNNLEAYTWYSQIDGLYDEPAYFMAFGKVLKKLGKYEEAGDRFTQFAKYDRTTGLHFAESCGFALDIIGKSDQRQVELYPMNSKEDDFSPSSIDGELVFSSFRTDLDKSSSRDYSLLYKSSNQKVSLLQDAFLGDINIASASFDQEMHTCAYFKHNFINGLQHLSKEEKNLAIFFSKIDGRANFLKEIPFTHNNLEYANAYPFLLEDGTGMIYSSNMPGGEGGFDLYITYRTEVGWTEPINLGSEINTPGNEISPMQSAQQLFFASDYHAGLGGYDIFSAEYTSGFYSNVINLQKGINSPEDDVYPHFNVDQDVLYFSSNRMGGQGKYDIYLATGSEEQNYLVTSDVPAKVDTKPDVYVLEELPTEPMIQDVAFVDAEASLEEDLVMDIEREDVMIEGIASVDFSHIYEANNTTTEVKDASFVDYSIKHTSAADIYEEVVSVEKVGHAPIVMETTDVEIIETEEVATKAVAVEVAVSEVPEVVVLKPAVEFVATDVVIELEDDVTGAVRVFETPVLESTTNAVVVDNNKEKAFFIQLGAFAETNGDVNRYGSLTTFGSIFTIRESGVTKIKLGYFYDRNQAEMVLSQVRSEGYGDAFITHNFIQSNELEVANVNYDSYTQPNNTYTGNSNSDSPYTGTVNYDEVNLVDTAPVTEYKVRLASYEDPIWFDVNKAKRIGNIEQWSKGKWTIFVLAGYDSFENASAAMQKAKSRGFADARVVLDENGILKELN